MKKKLKWTGGYTPLFLVGFCACYGAALLSGNSTIWTIDGLMQHYPYMMYVGQWIRQALTGNAVAFDFAIGLGEDVLASVNYYGLGDPVMLLSALFAGPSTEICYLLLAAVKSWLSGLACMALGRKVGLDRRQALGAGLIYAFSLGFFTEAATHHAMFANPYYQLPLMLLGFEHVLRGKRPWLLSLSVCLSALCGFYFLYCNSALLFIYALVRCFQQGWKKPWRKIPGTAMKAIGWYVLGIGLSACIFLPALHGFLNGQRSVDGNASLRLVYSLEEYLRFPMAALVGRSAGATPFVPVVSLLGITLMLFRFRRRRMLAMLAVVTAMLLTPAAGLVLNGFSYEASRWNYAAHLMLAVAGGTMLPELLTLTKKEKLLLGGVCLMLLGSVAVAVAMNLVGGRILFAALAAALVTGSLAAVLLVNRLAAHGRKRLASAVLAVILLGNVAAVHAVTWSGRQSEMTPSGESWAATSSSPYAGLPQTEAFGRTDSTIESTLEQMNASALEGVAGTSVYNSILNGRAFGFMADVESAGRVNINSIDGLDARAPLEALWSVNRFVCAPDAAGRIPYGFEYAGESANGHLIYENPNALPVAYAYSSAMTLADYDALSPLEKQWALMQCAALEEIPESIPAAAPAQSVQEIEILSVEMENIDRQGDLLTVGEDAVIRIAFDAPADCELYLQMDGFGLEQGKADMGNRIRFSCGDCSTYICLLPSGVTWSVDRPYYLVNLGYDEQARTTAEIRFSYTGAYRLEDLKLMAQPMADYAVYTDALRTNGLENAQVDNGQVSGEISLDAPGVLVFSIPFSEGWRAKVNGAPAETVASADAFLALVLPAGEHLVELTYTTPWLTAGCILSLLSLALIAGLGLAQRRRMKGANS